MGKFTTDLYYLYISEAVMTNNLWLFRTELGCLSRKEIIESVNDSLRNLGLEYIDLLIIHKNDPNCPLEGKKQHLNMDKMFSCCYKYAATFIANITPSTLNFSEVLRACTYLVDCGKIMYWGTSRWSPFELHEAYHKAKEYKLVAPVCEIGEYHWFHREKVELYMAELYNKIGE